MLTRTGLMAAGFAGSLVGATAAGAATLGANATAFALGDEGATLVTVASASGATSAVGLTFEGGARVTLDGIDYRPATGEIYGYDDATDAVYLINTVTGAATQVVQSRGITNDDDLDVDFNPTIDAARVVNGQNDNVVFAPNAVPPTLTAFTDLGYAAGDAGEGENPNVVFNAYTNAVAGATMTTQYVIDSELDTLATLANNTGVLTTVGQLALNGAALDVTEDGGFDILSFMMGDNTPYALLTDAMGMQGIYSLPLMADAMGFINLTFVSAVTADYGILDGFTVAPAPVPLPAAGLLLVAGLGSLAVVRRRRAAA